MKYIHYDVLVNGTDSIKLMQLSNLSAAASSKMFISEDYEIFVFEPDVRYLVLVPSRSDFEKTVFKFGDAHMAVWYKQVKSYFADSISHNEVSLFGDMAEFSHHVNMFNREVKEAAGDMLQ